MPRISTLISICLHAIVITIAVTSSVLSPGPLPTMRSMFAFHDVTPVTIAEVPQAPARSPVSRRADVASPDVAPIDIPDRIAPELPRASIGVGADIGTGDVGTTDGIGNISAVGVVVNPDAAPPPPPTAPLRLHAGIQAPVKTFDVKPVYPQFAQAAHQEGVVILEAVIDTGGTVQSVRVLKGYPLLDQAAVDAVRRWRFTPALLNKQPVPVVMTITVNFTLK